MEEDLILNNEITNTEDSYAEIMSSIYERQSRRYDKHLDCEEEVK